METKYLFSIFLLVSKLFFCQNIVFKAKSLKTNQIVFEIFNKSNSNYVLLMDISNLRVTTTKKYDYAYELFLSNVLILNNKKYAVPFTRQSNIYPSESNFGRHTNLSISEYVNENKLRIKKKQKIRLIFDLNSQNNILKAGKLTNTRVYIEYRGKELFKYLKKNKVKLSHDIYLKNIQSNKFDFSTFATKIEPPEHPIILQ